MKVAISKDGVWSGEGRWTELCEIVDCAAVLGRDQDASDETYKLLADELAGLPQIDDYWRGPVSVSRPDGEYTAELIDDEPTVSDDVVRQWAREDAEIFRADFPGESLCPTGDWDAVAWSLRVGEIDVRDAAVDELWSVYRDELIRAIGEE